MLRSVVSAFAAFERALRAQRTRAALAVKKSRGERVGSVPFGSRLAPDGVSLEAEQREVAALARIQALRAEGLAFRAIARALESEGHAPRGRAWHPETIRRAAAVAAVA